MIPVPSHHSFHHRWKLFSAALCIPILLLLFVALPANGQVRRWLQPDSVPPMRKVYNIGENDFIMGGRFETSRGDSISEIWRFARKLHINDWIWENGMTINGKSTDSMKVVQFHQLADMADSGEHLCTAHPLLWTVAGLGWAEQGQMMEVFAFDSAQSPYNQWKFMDVQGGKGSVEQNQFYTDLSQQSDWPWRDYYTTEHVYSDTNDAGLILQNLATLNVSDPAYTDWATYTSTRFSANDFSENVYFRFRGDPNAFKMWVALKGHMFPNPDTSVALTDTIFRIHLFHIVPAGKSYLDDNDDTIIATAWTEILIDSFAVTKGELVTNNIDLLKYRDISDSTDLRYRFNNPSLRGPYYNNGTVVSPVFHHADSTAAIFDVKVYWTGKEQAAIRSIMLRNRTAELMYGSSNTSLNFRQSLMDSARRVVYGVDSSGLLRSTDSIRPALFRIESGHESGAFGFGTFRALQRFIADSLHSGTDSVAVGMVENHPGLMHHSHTMGNLDVVHLEYNYYTDYFADTQMSDTPPFNRLPALREHNGGRDDKLVGPPELGLTADSIELYSFMMQRFQHGYYGEELDYGHNNAKHNSYAVQEIAHSAQISRDFGVPLIGIPGLVSYIAYDTNGLEWVSVYDPVNGTYVDSLTAKNNRSRIGHLQEVSEFRLADNMLLCYGGRGILYHWLTTYFTVLGADHKNARVFPKGFNGPDTIFWGERGDINIVGDSLRPYLEDRTQDVMDVALINREYWTGHDDPAWLYDTVYREGEFSDTIPGVYLGWKSRVDGLVDVNRRVKELGSEMARRRLRWRTSYSVHNQAIMPGTADTLPGQTH